MTAKNCDRRELPRRFSFRSVGAVDVSRRHVSRDGAMLDLSNLVWARRLLANVLNT
jgi:hypothetical protein